MVKKRIAVTGFGRVKLGSELGGTVIDYEHGLVRGQIFRRCKPDSLDRDDIEKELNNPENLSLDRLKQYFSTPKRSFERFTANILRDAGVLGEPYPLERDFSAIPKVYAPHQDVMGALSKEEKTEAENVAGNNWDIIVALNYVQKNFPIYSQEFYAAVWRYYCFVEKDDYKVGYLASEMGWRFSHEDDAVRGKKFDSKSTPRTGKATEANKNDRKKREQIVENFLSKMSPDKWSEFKAKSSGRIKVRPLARYIGSQNLFEGKVKTGMVTESIEKVIKAYLEKSKNTSI